MKFKGLDGKDYDFNIVPYIKNSTNSSQLHQRCRKILHKLFPLEPICEELTLPGTKIGASHQPLRADFFIPNLKLVVEAHGQQHYTYNSHFYQNKLEFFKAKSRDNDKRRWAEINGFIIIELSHNDSDEQWEQQLKDRR
jgi:hypothetical protein